MTTTPAAVPLAETIAFAILRTNGISEPTIHELKSQEKGAWKHALYQANTIILLLLRSDAGLREALEAMHKEYGEPFGYMLDLNRANPQFGPCYVSCGSGHDGAFPIYRSQPHPNASGELENRAGAGELLREREIPWLKTAISEAVANLGYPVGMGISPSEAHLEKAADTLFSRYQRMIDLASQGAFSDLAQSKSQVDTKEG
jgi:hypothetical protein